MTDPQAYLFWTAALGGSILVTYSSLWRNARTEYRLRGDRRSLTHYIEGLALLVFACLGLTGTFAIAMPEHQDFIRAVANVLRFGALTLGVQLLWLAKQRR